ncbi:MAG: hypothetical protein ACON5F_08715 [Jejuia sp.]
MDLGTDILNTYQLKQTTFCKYLLVTPNKEIQLTFPQMLEFRRKINQLTTFKALNRIVNSDNFVLLFLADKQHLIYLDIPQLLHLKDEISLIFNVPQRIYV